MTSKKLFFADEEKMKLAFAAIIEENPEMAEEKAFHDFLLGFAGKETNARFIILAFAIALGLIVGKHTVNLSGYADKLLDDADTIVLIKESLKSIAANISKAASLELPEFPKNDLGIQRGTLIRCNHIEVEKQLGVKVGEVIPVGYDGEYVRCGPFAWDIEQLCEEINGGYWLITGQADLSNAVHSLKFARKVERLNV